MSILNDYNPILHALEIESRETNERVRQMLYEAGRPDLVARFDAKMRDIETGVYGARNCWHSISPAQREALRFAASVGRRLIWKPLLGHAPMYAPETYDGRYASRPIRKPTMRNLCARELMAWDGGAFDPEAAAIITERGLFVIKHGPPDGSAELG